MMYVHFTVAAVLSLHTVELLVIIAAALTTGYLLKLFWSQWRNDAADNEAAAQETAVEVLQNKLSA
jgi:hypothetical protein